MPELPEVETVVRGLRKGVLGRKLVGFQAKPRGERAFAPYPSKAISQRLVGQRLVDIYRYGKFMLWVFERDMAIVHLRMTGNFILQNGVATSKPFIDYIRSSDMLHLKTPALLQSAAPSMIAGQVTRKQAGDSGILTPGSSLKHLSYIMSFAASEAITTPDQPSVTASTRSYVLPKASTSAGQPSAPDTTPSPQVDVLYFDKRRFGTFELVENDEESSLISAENVDIADFFRRHKGLGPDAVSAGFNVEYLRKRLGRKMLDTPIYAILMNQKIVAGVGNIYATEILFQLGISPFRKFKLIDDNLLAKLIAGLKKMLEESIEMQGTTFSDFINSEGHSGSFQGRLLLYGKSYVTFKGIKYYPQNARIAGRKTKYVAELQS